MDFLKRKLNKSTRQVSKKDESEASKTFSFLQRKNSGASTLYKGDIGDTEFIGECKTTGKKQITIRRDDLKKLLIHSSRAGKMPFLSFSFGEKRKWVILAQEDFKSILFQLRRKKNEFK